MNTKDLVKLAREISFDLIINAGQRVFFANSASTDTSGDVLELHNCGLLGEDGESVIHFDKVLIRHPFFVLWVPKRQPVNV